MKTTARRSATLAGLVVTIACAGIVPATVAQSTHASTIVAQSSDAAATGADSADGAHRSGTRRVIHVAGRQIPVDVENGLYTMRGALVGDWRYIPEKVLHDSPTLYVESGVEIFNGCIDRRPRDGKCTGHDYRGELRLAFLYWARFDLGGDLIRGRCVHPVTGGGGTFAGARGLLRMVDIPVGDQVRTSYSGKLVLNAVPTEGNAGNPSPSSAAATAVDQKTSTLSGRRAC